MSVLGTIMCFFLANMIGVIHGQVPPSSSDCINCVTKSPTESTTLIAYTDCDPTEYYVQGQCKKFSHELCSSLQNIGLAMVACNTTDSEMLRNFVLLTNEDKCNYYHRALTCILKQLQTTMPLCSSAEIRFVQVRHIETLLESLGTPIRFFLQLERCEVHSARVVLELLDTNWTAIFNNKSSKAFWAYRDQFDKEVAEIGAAVFGDLYRDSVVTNIREGSVLIDVTLFWNKANNLTSELIIGMLKEGLIALNTSVHVYDVESVDLVNKGLTCTVYGVTYRTGEMFRTRNLCNRCVCSNGNLYCTRMTCSAVWLGEYCGVGFDCAGGNITTCEDITCQCVNHYFPALDDSTSTCRKKGVNERCSSSEDCDTITACVDKVCSCLRNYVEVNNTCILYAERQAAPAESMVTWILVGVFSAIGAMVLTMIVVVFLKRREKLRKQSQPKKFINQDEEDPEEPLPTTLHADLYANQRSSFGDKSAHQNAFNLHDDEGVSDTETPPPTKEDDNEDVADPPTMDDHNNPYLWSIDAHGGFLPTGLHWNPYVGGSNFYKGRLARPNMFGDFTERDTIGDFIDEAVCDGDMPYDPEGMDELDETRARLKSLFPMSEFRDDDYAERRRFWNSKEHGGMLPTALHVNPFLSGSNFYKGRLARPNMFGNFTERDIIGDFIDDADGDGDMSYDPDGMDELDETRARLKSLFPMSEFRDDDYAERRRFWNSKEHGGMLPTALHVNPFLGANIFYKGRLAKPNLFGDFIDRDIDFTNTNTELNLEGDTDENNTIYDGQDTDEVRARLKRLFPTSEFKDDDYTQRKRFWNLAEEGGMLPTSLHVNPYLTGNSFYKGRLAKSFMFGDFTDDDISSPVRLNNLEDSDEHLPETNMNDHDNDDANGIPKQSGEATPKAILTNPSPMSVFKDNGNARQWKLWNIAEHDTILPTTMHANPYLTGHSFYKGRLSKPYMYGSFENDARHSPLRLNNLDDPESQLEETYKEDFKEKGLDNSSDTEAEGEVNANMTNPKSKSATKDASKRAPKLWNLSGYGDLLSTSMHMNPYLSGNAFYRGRLAKSFMFGDFTDGYIANPIRLNNFDDPDTYLPETYTPGDDPEPEPLEFVGEPKPESTERYTMSLLTDDDALKTRETGKARESGGSLPTTLHANPHQGGHTFYKGKLAKPNLLGDFEEEDSVNPYLSFA